MTGGSQLFGQISWVLGCDMLFCHIYDNDCETVN